MSSHSTPELNSCKKDNDGVRTQRRESIILSKTCIWWEISLRSIGKLNELCHILKCIVMLATKQEILHDQIKNI
jgi:hypothetical protein